jgi:hypothetical protein
MSTPTSNPPSNGADATPRDWLIRKSGYYYRPDRAGYTSDWHKAGRYTEAEAKAEARVESSISAWHQDSIRPDEPIEIADGMVTICGVRYAFDLFKTLGIAPIGETFQIVGREDGVLVLRRAPETAAEPKQDGESIWLLAFADQEAQPPLAFSGAGADAAARRKFERASDMWTCRLFRCVAQSGYGPPVTTDTRCPTCGESRPSHWAWCTDPLNKPAATTGEEHGS